MSTIHVHYFAPVVAVVEIDDDTGEAAVDRVVVIDEEVTLADADAPLGRTEVIDDSGDRFRGDGLRTIAETTAETATWPRWEVGW